jgi:PmbA protein
MERLLDMAKKVCDQAEIYSLNHISRVVSFENAKLHDIDSNMQSGLSLRIIKDGKLGFAYTRNMLDREEFLQNALESVKGGVEAKYEFPLTTDVAQLDTYNASVESLSSTTMVEECARVCDRLTSSTNAEIMAAAYASFGTVNLLNSVGTNLSSSFSEVGVHGFANYPGSGNGIGRVHTCKAFEPMPDALLDEIIFLYTKSDREAVPQTGRMKVLFMPQSLYTLTWRIKSGANAKSVYEKVSPIVEKVGERIFDPKLTLVSDPLNDEHPDARAFDDEGTPCSTFPLVEKGVLQGFYYDLNYAQKLNAVSTGHGFKAQQWGGDALSLTPNPALTHLAIKPGDTSFVDLVKSMEKGLIVEGALGAHSGNIPNGDYSIGADPTLYVENGEIVGRAKDIMVAGNIYDTLKHVVAIEDTLHLGYGGWFPAILCDNVSVSTKG